jgi:hypothetical protein
MSPRLYLECLGFILKSMPQLGHLGIPTFGIPRASRGKNLLHLLQYPYPSLYFDLDLTWADPETTCSVIAEFLSSLLYSYNTKNSVDDLPVERYPCGSAPP